MSNDLPTFEYHPDPLSTGSVVARKITCVSCGEERAYAYVGPIYTIRTDVDERVCPWCVKSGRAAEALKASFVDARIFERDGLASEVVEEVSLRTPGFASWQGQTWVSHCRDAAAFLGDATVEDVHSITDGELSGFLRSCGLERDEWEELLPSYVPKGDPSVYKFQCRHCRQRVFAMDCG
jgi:hypothetical protein